MTPAGGTTVAELRPLQGGRLGIHELGASVVALSGGNGRTIRRFGCHETSQTPVRTRTTTGTGTLRPPPVALNLALNAPQRRTSLNVSRARPSARKRGVDDGRRWSP